MGAAPLLPAVASFGYLALDDDGCSQGHEMLDCMSYQYCGGCYDSSRQYGLVLFLRAIRRPPYAPYVDTCAWSEDDGQYIMLTCTGDYDAAGVGGDQLFAGRDGCSRTPQEISYHVCEEICYGDDDDDDDDDDDCANPTSYGGFYCSYGQIALTRVARDDLLRRLQPLGIWPGTLGYTRAPGHQLWELLVLRL